MRSMKGASHGQRWTCTLQQGLVQQAQLAPCRSLESMLAGRAALACLGRKSLFGSKAARQVAAGLMKVIKSLLVGRATLASVGGAGAPFGMRSRPRAAARACSQDVDLTSASVSLLP